MYVEYENLMPDVVQSLINEGVEEKSFNKNRAIYAIQQAYKEFVKDTNVLRRVIEIPTQSNVNEYHLFKYDGHVISKIYSLSLEEADDYWRPYTLSKITASGCRKNSYTYNDGFINISNPPVCDGLSMSVCVSVFPETSSCLMDERIYELYREYIVHGAVARLLPSLQARVFREYFTIGKDEASSDAAKQWSKRTPKNRRLQWLVR